MNKKFKYTSLVAAGAVTLGLVGGTLAWFTAQDTEVNQFATGTVTDPDNDKVNAGIEIIEQFDQNGANNILPGATVNKDVQVQSSANYAQFVKVKLTPQFVKEENDKRVPYTDPELEKLGITNDMIQLNVVRDHVVDLSTASSLPDNLEQGKWYLIDGEYYYYGKLAPQGTKDNEGTLIDYTNTLLDSVTLKSEADNNYKNKVFDVKVEAYSIQASNKAASDEWFKGATGVLSKLKTKFEELESKEGYTAPEDSKEVYESEDTNGSHIHKAPSSSTK